MLRVFVLSTLLPALAMAAPPANDAKPRVKIETTKGAIVVELDPAKAPKTVANFLEYVRLGHYYGSIFHRVIPGFMIQGGGFGMDEQRKTVLPPIVNEAANGLANLRGTIAMARTSDVNSATDQFFINLKDNRALDHKNDTPEGFGYCVFGRVVEGMSVVDAIAKVPTAPGRISEAVPREQIVIGKVTLLK